MRHFALIGSSVQGLFETLVGGCYASVGRAATRQVRRTAAAAAAAAAAGSLRTAMLLLLKRSGWALMAAAWMPVPVSLPLYLAGCTLLTPSSYP